MVVNSDNALMKLALDEAWKYQGLTFPNPAVGAVISDENGHVIALGAHKKAGFPHAEVEAIKQAYIVLSGNKHLQTIENSADIHTFLTQNHHNLFHNLTLHVTLEPCNHFGKTPPCSQLIQTLGFKRVIIGALDTSVKAKGGGEFLRENGIEVSYGCLKEACDELLAPFLALENHKPFLFFKLALSSNNVATGGIITSKASRYEVHRLRDKCDLLVIGGNTVRVDRPLLDARLCDGVAPDVLIYSKEVDFDKSIPLFLVKNRKVFIDNTLEKVKNYQFIMIEGGQGMLDAVSQKVDWYLIFQSPHTKNGESIVFPSHLKEVFSTKIGEDKMIWYKKV